MGHEDDLCSYCKKDWKSHTFTGMEDGKFLYDCKRDSALGIDPNMALIADYKEFKTLVGVLRNELADANQTINLFTKDAQRISAEAEAKLAEQRDEHDKLVAALTEKQNLEHALDKAKLGALNESIANVEDRCKTLEERNVVLLGRNSTLEERDVEICKIRDELKADKAQLTEEKRLLERAKAGLEADLELHKGEVAKLKKEVATLKSENLRLKHGQDSRVPTMPPAGDASDESSQNAMAIPRLVTTDTPAPHATRTLGDRQIIGEREVAGGGTEFEGMEQLSDPDIVVSEADGDEELAGLDDMTYDDGDDEGDENRCEAPDCVQTATHQASFEQLDGEPVTVDACNEHAERPSPFLDSLQAHVKNPPKDEDDLRTRFREISSVHHHTHDNAHNDSHEEARS